MLIPMILIGLLVPTAGPQASTTSAPASEIDWVEKCRNLSPPAETVEIHDLPMTLMAGEIVNWSGGNRLVINEKDRVQVLPNSYVPGSLALKDSAGEKFESPRDYVVNEAWGAFAIASNGQLHAGQKILASYRFSLRRVDAVIIYNKSRVAVIRGQPSADCPLVPELPENVQHVADIYRPFNANSVRAEHIYRIHPVKIDLSPLPPSPELQRVIQKLRNGEDVTIVCWGDSVTVGVDSGPPGTNYVSRLEAMLKEKYPKARLKVMNAGISGSNIHTRLPNVQKEVFDFHPDLITFEFVNDMGVPVDELTERYPQFLEKVHAAGAALIMMTPHFVMPSMMPAMPKGHGSDPRACVAFMKEFTKKQGIPLADASRRWEQLLDLGIPYEILLRNGINHPDERGHIIFAEELMRFFE